MTRQLCALAAMGWPPAEIARRTIQHLDRPVHERLALVYSDLEMRVGPDTELMHAARAQGHPTPLAWDDIATDHAPPASRCSAKPRLANISFADVDHADVNLAAAGRIRYGDLRRVDRIFLVCRMQGWGLSKKEIARRTAGHWRQVDRDATALVHWQEARTS